MPLRLLAVLLLCGLASCASRRLDATFSRALEAQQAGRHQEAIDLYRTIVAEDPGSSGAWHNLGATDLLLGEGQNALHALDQAIATSPDDILSRYLRAIALLQENRFTEVRHEIGALRVRRDQLVNATVTRLGQPTYAGIDMRVVGPAFDARLEQIVAAAKTGRVMAHAERLELISAVLVGPAQRPS